MTKSIARGSLSIAAIVLLTSSIFAAQTKKPTLTPNPQEPPKQAGQKTGNAFTDGWITMKVHAQFIPENALDGSDIDVDTKDGVVTLSGTVPTDAGRTRAVAIAKATDGVKNVEDRLRIGPAEGISEARDAGRKAGEDVKGTAGKAARAVTDGWIKSKIYAQFVTEDVLNDSDIDVDAVKGVVTLKGRVPSQAAHVRAMAIAKGTDGVKSVNDMLKIVPK